MKSWYHPLLGLPRCFTRTPEDALRWRTRPWSLASTTCQHHMGLGLCGGNPLTKNISEPVAYKRQSVSKIIERKMNIYFPILPLGSLGTKYRNKNKSRSWYHRLLGLPRCFTRTPDDALRWRTRPWSLASTTCQHHIGLGLCGGKIRLQKTSPNL